MTVPATFRERLIEAQRAAEINTETLARQVGVGLRVVQRWRSGDTEPAGRNLVRLAAVLRRDPAWFFEDQTAEQVPA